MNDVALKNLARQIDAFVHDQCPGPKPSSREVGSAFCRWCLTELYGLGDFEAEEAMIFDGPNDNSIDAVFELNNDLYVLQTKYGTSHSRSNMLVWLHQVKGLQEDGDINGQRPEILAAVEKIRSMLASGQRVHFMYITNRQFNSSQLSTVKNTAKNFSGCRFIDVAGMLAMIQERALELPDDYKKRWFSIEVQQPPLRLANESLVIPLPVGQIWRLVQLAGEYLYVSDIRSYLRRTKVNQGIETTLANEPAKFWFYNNGITIVCDDLTVDDLKVSMKAPQVVNGCQTASSINSVLQRPAFKHLRTSPDTLVSVRVFKGVSSLERNLITQWTNSQNSIRGKDFLSLKAEHKTLQERLRAKGYYYEVQRGAYHLLGAGGSQNYRGNERLYYLTPQKVATRIPGSEAIQSYVAGIVGNPHVAYGRIQEVMPFGNQYHEAFPAGVSLEPEHFLYPYLVGQYAVQALNYGRSGEGYKRFARWLYIFAYFGAVCQLFRKIGLFNDSRDARQHLNLGHLQSLMESREINTRLLNLVDQVMQAYFSDSTTRRMLSENNVAFFKAGCATTESRSILFHWLDTKLADSEGKALIIATQRITSPSQTAD